MREILFKAKLKDWKSNPQKDKWVEGFYLKRKETTYCFTEDYERFPVETLHYIAVDSMTDWGLPNEFRCFEIDSYTLCQYTGLTDKNGNKIWENDIVKKHFYTDYDAYANSEEYIGVATFADYAWVIETKNDTQACVRPIIESLAYSHDIEYFEVIGNVFDNPDKE